jgi:diamine N-acetyltransferase
METRLRSPTPADVPALAAIGRETFIDTFGHLYSEADLSAYLSQTHTVASVTEALATQGVSYQLAEVDDALVGYARVAPLGIPFQQPGRSAMELTNLYVVKTYLGTGIAHALMAWAMDQFAKANVDDVFLSVFSENKRAQAFYAKYGFTWHADYFFMVGNHRDEEFVFHKALRP